MQTRHRVPTVFTLYMVDVLCCALGCVILLWFLKINETRHQVQAAEDREKTYAQEAQQRDKTIEETRAQVQAAHDRETMYMQEAQRREKVVQEASRGLARTQVQLAETTAAMGDALQWLDESEKGRAQLSARLADLDKELGSLKVRHAVAEERLAKQTRQQADLDKELAGSRQRSVSLEALLRQKEMAMQAAAHSADELAERVRGADARLKLLQAQVDLLPGLRDEVQAARSRAAALEMRVQALDREVTDRRTALAGAGKDLQGLQDVNLRLTREVAAAGRTIASLQGENHALADQFSRVKSATENRFAGVTLSGRRVVFLIDMSGSMELVDERTAAPEKWTGVRETLVKVMRSLPELEKYQIILFSDKASYLLNNDERWLDYDPQTSADRALNALSLIKPQGNTNMYAALEEAFRFRPLGLDTIYLLSDGLPNIGEGLNVQTSRHLTETERAEILSKHVRRMLVTDWNRAGVNQPRVHVNAIGFFYESPDVGAFLWALTRENEGSFVGMSKP